MHKFKGTKKEFMLYLEQLGCKACQESVTGRCDWHTTEAIKLLQKKLDKLINN